MIFYGKALAKRKSNYILENINFIFWIQNNPEVLRSLLLLKVYAPHKPYALPIKLRDLLVNQSNNKVVTVY